MNILFVCLGNICRSPMAEYIFRDMLRAKHKEGLITCSSAATSSEESGNPVYPPARRVLLEMGIDPSGKRAVTMRKSDYERYDLLIGMEASNLTAMRRITGGDPLGKMKRLMDYTSHPCDIADPWYTGDFKTVKRQITEGCACLLEAILSGRP